MLKKDWTAELKKLTYTKGADALKMEITPYRDWRIVVWGFFVGLILAIWFNIYMLVKIDRDSFFTPAQKSSGVIKFNEEGLAKVIAWIDEKQAKFEKAKTEVVTIVDPSL